MEDLRFLRVSNAELERRWALLRKLAADKKLDALVTATSEDDNTGYAPWFTGSLGIAYRKVVVFHANDLMTVVTHGAFDQKATFDGKDPENPGVGTLYGTPEFPAAHYSLGYEADIVVAELKKRGYKRIGLVGVGNMHHRFVQKLTDGLSGAVTFSDETDVIDGYMVVKSAEELDIIRKTAKIQDHLFATALKHAKPGMRDADLNAIIRAEAIRHGCAGGIIMNGSGAPGTFAAFRPVPMQNRVIQPGDYMPLLIEVSGPGGYFTEVARVLSFGKMSAALAEATAACTEMQDSIIKTFKPGTPCADIFAQHNRDRATYKLPPEARIFAHGQGYNLVERPLIRQDEPMKIVAGMNLAVHPTIADGRSMFAVMCDNFIVGADGSMERIHATEKKTFEI
jgi:Xaa-Pro aminopeptidase